MSKNPKPRPQKARPSQPHDTRRVQRPSTDAPKRARKAAPRPKQPHIEGEDRLQKILAHAGIGSRRACEELILQGRVTVDGKIFRELGTRVDPAKVAIAIDGQKIREEKHVYYAINKPKGYVSTNDDPSGRPRVVDILPEIPQRVYAVGRLDEMSVGLMILTNDGELANKLAHPKFGVEKVYRAVVAGLPTVEVLDQVVEGVWLAEGKVRARHIKIVARKGDSTVLDMVLAEGKNREVRRMLAKLGHKVMALTRVAIGPITLKGLNPGTWRSLRPDEVDLLRKVAAGVPVGAPRFGERKGSFTRSRVSGGDGPRPVGRPTGPGARSRPGIVPPRPAFGGSNLPGGPTQQGPGGARRPGGPPVQQGPPSQVGERRPGGPPRPGQGRPPYGAGHRADGPPAQGGERRPGGPPRPQGAPAYGAERRPGGPPRPGQGRPGQAGGARPSGQGGGVRRPPDREPSRRIIGLDSVGQAGSTLRLPAGPPPSQRTPAGRRPSGPPPRPEGGGERRPPRHEGGGGQGRPPRPEGQGERRPPRPESGGGQGRPPRPEVRGDRRPPRPEASGGGRPPRPEDGGGRRPPRPEPQVRRAAPPAVEPSDASGPATGPRLHRPAPRPRPAAKARPPKSPKPRRGGGPAED